MRAVVHEAPDEVREQQFIADRDAGAEATGVRLGWSGAKGNGQRPRPCAGRDVAARDAARDRGKETAQQTPEGHVLAERHQVRLVVALEDPPIAVHQERTVEELGHATGAVVAQPHAADHEGRGGLPREGHHQLTGFPVGLDAAGHGGLRPDHDLRPLARRAAREVRVRRERTPPPLGAPLHVLLDVALNDRHANMGQSRLVDAGQRGEAESVSEQDDHRRAPHGGARADAAPEVESGARQRRSAECAHERQTVDPGVRHHTHQREVLVLRIAEGGPGKPREQETAHVIQRGPQHRDGERVGRAAHLEPREPRAESRGEDRDAHRETHGREEPDDDGRVAVRDRDDVDPVEDRRVRDETRQATDSERPTRRESAQTEDETGRCQPREDDTEIHDLAHHQLRKRKERGADVRSEPAEPPSRCGHGVRGREVGHVSRMRHSRRSSARITRASSSSTWS